MRYLYKPYQYIQTSEEYGAYRTVGIRCYREDRAGLRAVTQIGDVSTERTFVERLAERCTAMQLRPVHLYDVVVNAIP